METATSRQTSIGVAQNIFDKYFISTAMWATSIQGMKYPTYETFIWEWDKAKKERGKLIKQYYHESRCIALKFHFRFCQTVAYREFKSKMPNDHAWIDMDN